MTDHLNGNANIFDAGHPDLIDDHWTAVCHHGHTVMFDESNPFTFVQGELVRSLDHEPSAEAWEAAGFQVEELGPFPSDPNEDLDVIQLNYRR
jgi:hypothetical protein